MQESGEMYLETILVTQKEKQTVRAVDIAQALSFSKPSVSKALSKLKEDGYITVDKGGLVVLTEKGRESAEKIYERHRILTIALTSIGVDAETAATDACKIEHDISDAAFDAIKKHFT